MKLNTKRTMLVGLAFLSICIFWQMYDSVMTLILTDTFHLNETIAGAVMAADNVLALFLLPLFGALSDKTNTRIGRRMPYIIGGTAAAVILMNLLPVLDNAYAASPSPLILGLFIAVLALLLVAMGVYRSPAVALMPDVTPKPLRSRGNAVINLMGAVGGILYLALAAVLYPASRKVAGHVDYQPLFIIVSLIMAVSVLELALTVKEKRLSEENRALEKQHPDWNLAAKDESGNEVLPKEVKRSLTFLLASISLWFIAYNGVTTWFTKYIEQVMGEGLGGASTCLLVATAGAICSYIPIGALAAKIGRKNVFSAFPNFPRLIRQIRPYYALVCGECAYEFENRITPPAAAADPGNPAATAAVAAPPSAGSSIIPLMSRDAIVCMIFPQSKNVNSCFSTGSARNSNQSGCSFTMPAQSASSVSGICLLYTSPSPRD